MNNYDSLSTGTVICSMCTRKIAKYTCPRCSINYCSLDCYRDRRHGKCSEQFYRKCCTEAAADLMTDPKTREQVARMLDNEDDISDDPVTFSNAKENENSEDSDDEPDELSERLADIDLTADNFDVNAVWSRLTIEEKRDFHRQLSTGKIYSSVPVWTPWWEAAAKELISSFPDDADPDSNQTSEIKPTKPLFKIISTAPHPSVLFSLAEVILGFSYTSRYLNGDYLKGLFLEASDLILKLVICFRGPQTSVANIDPQKKTRVLNSRTSATSLIPAPIFVNFEEVLASFQAELALNGLTCSLPVLLLASNDLHCLLQNTPLLRRCLFEIETVLSQSLNEVKSSPRLRFAHHKVRFLRACVEDEVGHWAEKNLPHLQKIVATSLCGQTVRMEAESIDVDKNARKNVPLAGPNWRNIIRSKQVDASDMDRLRSMIELINK